MKPTDEDKDYITAEILEQYFLRSGKRISLEKIRELMDECGQQCGIEGFNSSDEIKFDTFF